MSSTGRTKIYKPTCDRTLRHVRLAGTVGLLRYGNASRFFDTAQRGRAIAVVSRNDHGDDFAVPMLSKGTQKNRNYVWPASGFRYWRQTEFAVENVQITLRRYDEDMVGFENQSFRDQFDRHGRVVWQNFVKPRSHDPQMINDDDGNPHIGR